MPAHGRLARVGDLRGAVERLVLATARKTRSSAQNCPLRSVSSSSAALIEWLLFLVEREHGYPLVVTAIVHSLSVSVGSKVHPLMAALTIFRFGRSTRQWVGQAGLCVGLRPAEISQVNRAPASLARLVENVREDFVGKVRAKDVESSLHLRIHDGLVSVDRSAWALPVPPRSVSASARMSARIPLGGLNLNANQTSRRRATTVCAGRPCAAICWPSFPSNPVPVL